MKRLDRSSARAYRPAAMTESDEARATFYERALGIVVVLAFLAFMARPILAGLAALWRIVVGNITGAL